MANLKLDLVNKLNNEKYYEEIELIRLAGDANMCYKEKMVEMSERLEDIAMLNAQLGLIEQYFKEPAPQNVPAPEGEKAVKPAPQGQAHNGQSHAE